MCKLGYYEKKRRETLNKIHYKIKDLSVDQLEQILADMTYNKPLTLKEYIRKDFESTKIGFGSQDVFRKKEILEAFEHEIRALCLELGSDFSKIEPECEYVDHFCELWVDRQELDVWIQSRGPLFNSWDLANIIFKLYCKEITFW